VARALVAQAEERHLGQVEMPDGDRDLRHAVRADVADAVPVELHVGHRAGRPESFHGHAPLDAGREAAVRRLGDVPLVVQREAERGSAFGHDLADRRVETGTGKDIDDDVLKGPELALEHALEAALLVVFVDATEVVGQIAILRQDVAHHRIVAPRHRRLRA
jgi:hypothetical protein